MNHTRTSYQQPARLNKKYLSAAAAGRHSETHLSQPRGASTDPTKQRNLVETASGAITTEELISRAKYHIGTGETSRNDSFRAAADDIALACDQGATQREIAQGVGKSPAWVNRLLQWRKDGYAGAPFADKVVQGVNNKGPAAPRSSIEPSHPAGSGAIDAEIDASQKQTVAKTFSSDERTLLVQNLEFLATERPRLRAQFATNVETRRARLGLTWDQLLVSADAVTPSLDLNLERNESVGREGCSSDMPDIPLSLRRNKPKVTRDQVDAAWRSCRDLMLLLEPEDRQRLSADVIEPFLAAHRLPVEVYKADASHNLRGDAHGE